MNTHATIAIIGAGNMGSCLAGGLIANHYPAKHIWLSDPSTDKLTHLAQRLLVNITTDNLEAIKTADVIILAIKPDLMQNIANSLANQLSHKPLIISIAAGIPTTLLTQWLSKEQPIVRVMPNTPALIGCGASGLFANKHVSPIQHALAESIMRAVGVVAWLKEEAQMDTVTALSGSGPAYFFLIIEALQDAAEKLGLSKETARLLTLQTAYGASRMALESEKNITELRQQVTSPGGTTEQGIAALEKGNLRDIFKQALQAAKNRSEELAK
jgi:pyrroline-5-carboxylate reductase